MLRFRKGPCCIALCVGGKVRTSHQNPLVWIAGAAFKGLLHGRLQLGKHGARNSGRARTVLRLGLTHESSRQGETQESRHETTHRRGAEIEQRDAARAVNP